MKSNILQELAKIIRYHRERSGLSQLELAKLAGIGKTVVFELEHGKKTVQFDTLLKVLEALNIDLQLSGPLMEAYRKENHEKS